MENNFTPNYIKCPNCQNILNMSFCNTTCPNPLCGFNFAGLEAYLSKSEEELRRILTNDRENKNSKEYKLVVTAIKHNMAEYLVHFIECTWGAHYNTLYKDFILVFLDDLNILKNVLKSDIIKDNKNTTISKNGYKMYWELYCRLIKIPSNPDIRNFLRTEFPALYRKYYNEWLLRQKKHQKKSIQNPKATLL